MANHPVIFLHALSGNVQCGRMVGREHFVRNEASVFNSALVFLRCVVSQDNVDAHLQSKCIGELAGIQAHNI